MKKRSFRYLFLVSTLYLVILKSCFAQVPGCTDPLAYNYNPSATVNDGSCMYDPFSISPISTNKLSNDIAETSGLLLWDGGLWTINDSGDEHLYNLDLTTGEILTSILIDGVSNNDWEEITHDDEFIYIGDFGNNASGDRDDLKILRVRKDSIIMGVASVDYIHFTYPDQTNTEPLPPNETDFDCEAFVVVEDSIYLFTKQWISKKTGVYRIPKLPGSYTAFKAGEYNIEGLITGAALLESERLLVLCGYTSLLHPFLKLLYDFKDRNYFSGNKRRITISLPFHQIEGIVTADGINYYASNEYFEIQPFGNTPQKLHQFNLQQLLSEYFSRNTIDEDSTNPWESITLFPIPATNKLTLKVKPHLLHKSYEVFDIYSRIVDRGFISAQYHEIDTEYLKSGIYILVFDNEESMRFEIVK